MTAQLFIWSALFLAGAALAGLWLGGLWLTVRSLDDSSHPLVLLGGSLLLRLAAVAAAFWLLMGNDWRRLAIALAGFLLARIIVLAAVRPRPQPTPDGGAA